MSLDKKNTDLENQVTLSTKIESDKESAFLKIKSKNENSSVNIAIKVGIFMLLAIIVILLLVIINRENTPISGNADTALISRSESQESSREEESLLSEVSENTEQPSEDVSEELSEVSGETSVYDESVGEFSEISIVEEEPSLPNMLVIDRVVNRKQSDAEKALKEKGFNVKINKVYSDEVEFGKVVSQSPAYFTLLEEGGTVTLNVSRGSEKNESSSNESKTDENSKNNNRYDIPIINVVGREENDSAKILKSQGFKVQTVYMSSTNVRKGFVIEQSPSGGIKQKYGDEVTLYVSKGLDVTVSFDTNGGASTSYTKVLEYGGKYGELPVPKRDNYDFQGWYTGVKTGARVTEDTIVSQAYDHILYARWKEKPLSEWILDKDVPSGARIAEVKWTYTLTQTISSELPVMGGWKQAGSYWKDVGKGISYYASFNESDSSGYNHNDKYYSQYNHPFLSDYNDGTQKREVTTKFHTYLYWHWCSNITSVSPENMPIASNYNADIYSPKGNFLGRGLIWEVFESKNEGKESNGKFKMEVQSKYSYWWNRITVYSQSYTDYKKYYQYYKVENKESSTPVTVSDSISNIKRYVRYFLP